MVQRHRVVFYGHKLTGNLLAILREIQANHIQVFEPLFLTMDPAYHTYLRRKGEPSRLAIGPECVKLLATADAIISDHGLHAMKALISSPNLFFFDVWHGIPFKGFDADDFRLQHKYTETWVASPLLRDLYIQRFGFYPDKVAVTGYARTDALAQPRKARESILRRLGLEQLAHAHLVLFAPTWQQDDPSRTSFPFNTDPSKFLERLSAICGENRARLLFRAHLNVNSYLEPSECGVVSIPFAEEPDTEALLQVTDVLICDWSSIAFDFLVLERPTIFLDVSCPFGKGFSLGPEYRYGRIAHSAEDTEAALREALGGAAAGSVPTSHLTRDTKYAVYQGYVDGHSAERCVSRLYAHLSDPESSLPQRS